VPAPGGSVRPTPGATLGGALRHGVALRLRCTTPCRARVVLRVGGRVAGVVHRHLPAGRTTAVRVHLRPRMRADLRTRTRATFRVTIALRGPGGGRTLRRTIALRR
jgi:hypothetical protein